ncbi:hypothetical protein [Bacteroides timonensis]|uniref:hypothetical protein n=1 Tax=Bacteroides timonensis TaxID=1470345 RepID=UPI0004B4BCB6|nr:hypothetical protein [Bacteroides timonensis]
MKEEKVVNIALVKIQETAFRFNTDFDYNGYDREKITVGYGQKFHVDIQAQTVGVELTFIFSDKSSNTDLVTLSVNSIYAISNLSDILMVEDGVYKTNEDHVIPKIIKLSIGTMRGILYMKLKDTILSDMLLPLIPSDFISATGNIDGTKAG